MDTASSDPYAIYPARLKGIGTRRWIEMVGALHRLGYGGLRLACSWENAGPSPVWFGIVAPGYMYVACGPARVERFDLPPPGFAQSLCGGVQAVGSKDNPAPHQRESAGPHSVKRPWWKVW